MSTIEPWPNWTYTGPTWTYDYPPVTYNPSEPMTPSQVAELARLLDDLKNQPQVLMPGPSSLHEALEREALKPDLPDARRLAIAVLLGEEDAVWPLIDSILEERGAKR